MQRTDDNTCISICPDSVLVKLKFKFLSRILKQFLFFDFFLTTAKRYLKETVKQLIDDRKANPPNPGKEIMLDCVLSYSDDYERQIDDAVTFTIGGFHNDRKTIISIILIKLNN